MCKEAGYEKNGIAFSDPSSKKILAWFKYGGGVSTDEAFTQAWVAAHLNAQPDATVKAPNVYMTFMSPNPFFPIQYIIMEYIDASDCGPKDYKLVAQAVNTLIRIKAPSSTPGHIGSGRIVHSLFTYLESDVRYMTIKEIQDHFNGVSEHEPPNASRFIIVTLDPQTPQRPQTR